MQSCGILLLLMTGGYLDVLEFPSETDLLPQANHLHCHQLGTVVSGLKRIGRVKGKEENTARCSQIWRI